MVFELPLALDQMNVIDPLEKEYLKRMLRLHYEEPKAYIRESLKAHFTASAILIDSKAEKILLLHHKKLDRWLQPGGHADGNKCLPEVSMKELHEETNAVSSKLMDIIPFDLDIHTIPENKNEPEHQHFDLRFLWITDNLSEVKSNKESKGLKWIPVKELVNFTDGESSFIRIQKKIFSIQKNLLETHRA
ncbi:NUDIX hydrolase [Mangrovivirga sp. M17]|uniref:NUDIX hydrolase n=1 Tax=Mangrovivirga halotolerans TaxID=2993936 RepID=A0ABT3RNR8_9BACT|nr:NUDIX hydrolase [Mangrovivirga halotolerans]MCX2743444.1 NUDIX hydrolase [Mangrovivirga halotolerans]